MGSERSLYRPIHLPGLALPGNILLAPLAGYTDSAFRTICLEAGAVLAFTEMVSCEALVRDRRRTLDIARRAYGERYLATQLFGSSPDSAAGAVERLLPLEPDLIDLNCGCSVPKVLRSGGGAALLMDPDLIERIVGAMVRASTVPVSVKLRSGWDEASINYLSTAKAAVAGGARMVTLHPRTRARGFAGQANWDHIADLKRSIDVPVLGSGDLFAAEDARAMLTLTGCDGLMFARGAIGNPFVFTRTRALLEGREPPPHPDSQTRLEMALRQLDLAVAAGSEPLACREMRKHIQAYTRGLPEGARLRHTLMSASSRAEYARSIREYLDSHPPAEGPAGQPARERTPDDRSER